MSLAITLSASVRSESSERLAKRFFALILTVIATSACCFSQGEAQAKLDWLATWAAAQQVAAKSDLPDIKFADVTLRQIVHVSVGGKQVRLRISNVFGKSPLEIGEARIALSAGESAIQALTDRRLTFLGRTGKTLGAGEVVISDAVDFDLPALSSVTISLHIKSAPPEVTSHPGSRTTSFLAGGNSASSASLLNAAKIDRWYFITDLEVATSDVPRAIAILGDSITDGRGSTTNGNNRWPDYLAQRLQTNGSTRNLSVLNLGIGGNRLLRDGLGPSGLSRLDRDIFERTGVRWLIVLEGVNDLGTRLRAKETGEAWATAQDLIAGYEQIISRAHEHGAKVYGATILPFGGSFYSSPDTLADRLKINDWILTRSKFDGVIDLAKATCDPEKPDYLLPAYDTGDHIHLTPAGYKAMADAIPLSLFSPKDPEWGTAPVSSK